MIALKKEIEEEIANGNEYNLSPEEKARREFRKWDNTKCIKKNFQQDPEIKNLMIILYGE